jgi:hypothetical protein
MQSAVEMPKGKKREAKIDLTYILLLLRSSGFATFLKMTRLGSHGKPAPGCWVGQIRQWFETSIVGNMPTCHVKSQRNADGIQLTSAC